MHTVFSDFCNFFHFCIQHLILVHIFAVEVLFQQLAFSGLIRSNSIQSALIRQQMEPETSSELIIARDIVSF